MTTRIEQAPTANGACSFAPLRDYAAIGDGRTAALVSREGSVDWMCTPDLDSPSIFARILDLERGGAFSLRPEIPFTPTRRYIPGTNVLETTFDTAHGRVTVTDALTFPSTGLEPGRELVRRIEGVSGSVPLRWRVEPRFLYGERPAAFTRRTGFPVASDGREGLGVLSYGTGEPEIGAHRVVGRFELGSGESAFLALSFAHQEPLVFPARPELESRLDATIDAWRTWSDGRRYDGPFRDAVLRSALALKLLLYAPAGSIAAAATTSLPEHMGGERNWDYRYSWIRDSAFTIDAFLQLGCPAEAQAYFWWLMHATQLTQPRLRVLYRLDGGTRTPENELPLDGHRGSHPVRIGNGAADQLQLDTYGELMQTAWLYAEAGSAIDRDIGKRLAAFADHVCSAWEEPDAGIWEPRSGLRHHTQSKMMCAVALDRAAALSEEGHLPRREAATWRERATEIRRFVETRCWSDEKRAYTIAADSPGLDASVLLGLLHGYAGGDDERMRSTVAAVRRELADGPFVRRYTDDDGLEGTEGAFVACSFWLVEALARTGSRAEAWQLMKQLIDAGNDVGLYSEEIDPDSGEFLGNMPQGLSHLALISAATALEEAAA